MAVQSFWVSVELTPEEKERVQAIVREELEAGAPAIFIKENGYGC